MEKLSTIQQINSAIMFGKWTDVELRSMADAIRFNQTSLRKQVKRNLDVGVRVRWVSSKNPAGATGTVKKIAIKYVTVRNDRDGGWWKIPANMLEIVEGQMATA
jgi:hypothetical protein